MKNTFLVILISIATSITVPLRAQQGTAKKSTLAITSKEEVSKVINSIKKHKAILVDVRTPEEYNEGHLKFSKNIDFKSDDFKTLISKLDKTKTIYLYCRSGNRSGKALDTLRALGFKAPHNIGGYADLQSVGFPTQQ